MGMQKLILIICTTALLGGCAEHQQMQKDAVLGDGLFIRYHANGQMAEFGHMFMGPVFRYPKDIKSGRWNYWYESGQRSAVERWQAIDTKLGSKTSAKEAKQEWGRLISAIAWKPDGKKCPETNVLDGNGTVVSYYLVGQKQSESNYKDGQLVSIGVWKPDGEKCPESNLKDGEGVKVFYKEDGAEKSRSSYKKGIERRPFSPWSGGVFTIRQP